MRDAEMRDHGPDARARKVRKRRIVRVVIAVLVSAAVAEPLVMYRVLVHQREDRRAMAEAPLAPSTGSQAR
jgi:hypothetical protein